jgi:hypothetical protein
MTHVPIERHDTQDHPPILEYLSESSSMPKGSTHSDFATQHGRVHSTWILYVRTVCGDATGDQDYIFVGYRASCHIHTHMHTVEIRRWIDAGHAGQCISLARE